MYCRVSTKEQADEGNSLVSQERICREYAAKEGYQIAQVYIERGESAKTANRKQLQLLLKFCTGKKGVIQAVIAYKVDRISRNIADYHVIRGTLKRYGVEIRSVTEFFEDTPAGRFMENIIANVGQFDNDVRTERSLGGMREATQEGRYVWMAPIGYSNVKINGKSTIAPNDKAALIQKVFELIATRQYSTNSIRLIMSKQGLTNRKGGPVTCSNFFHFLRNPLYKGVVKKFGNEYQGTFQALITPKLFDTVQSILDGRKNVVSHYLHENPDFPLRRFLTNEAGNKITGYWSQGKRIKYPYYSFKLPHTTIRKEVLEEKFMSFLAQYEFDTLHFNRMQYHLKEQFEKRVNTVADENKNIEKQIADLNKRIDSLIELKTNGTISLNTFTERVKRAESDIEQLEGLLKTSSPKEYDIDELMSFAKVALKKPHLLWQKSPLHIQQRLQVFDFPEGVTFDGVNCRTPKVCNLFRLKVELDHELFSTVPSGEKSKNTRNKLSSPPSSSLIYTKAYWEMIADEILTLKSIVLSPDNPNLGSKQS
ncbi:recombinase family protein [Mucilaginibacter sp.]|uniref:recombinase family protein n=1 Tax=Mucilaginibacter sp. TaxID=1882438 RepID=UPI0025F9A3FC|nr:recombinase family protein [Mucilaginibacter sp.]